MSKRVTKQPTPEPTAAETPAIETTTIPEGRIDPLPRFEISMPQRDDGSVFSGQHPLGLRFLNGVAETDEPVLAHAMRQEHGAKVTDRTTGKPAFEPEEKAKK